ncbi:MAG: glycosyltransferase family 4 protein [candidate division KSB1 bacterium]|nr:glycosyltransferase family 4 protein [candidate division KSB1 bacterium]MDZ7276000.1 glycosyltransferase family 4 protein [candidate division KSB1 bacterium]MDZ7285718.1 glycosyltransferase family 4 protein [candidate division KSB1 bacterium]MDZ7298750.1 glycosyltransferase family 4 protein [candidate division KSB1 bacterium]MDZ7305933.1 glycosyltransferase family 4 protein [candidate division KSB1 bacterium]
MSSRKRILHVIDKLSMDGVNPSSVALCFIEWIRHADTRRFEVMVAVLRPPDAASKHLEQNGVRLFYIDKGKYSFANVGAIVALARREQIDLLHLHGYSAANFGRLAASRLGIPALMHEWAILRVLPHQFAMDWLLRHQTDLAVGVSESVREFLIHGRRVAREKTRVVWNGVNLANFTSAEPAKVAAFREKFALAPHHLVVGTMTRLREEKGNRYFVEAAARVARACPEARFVIAGDGPLRAELEALAAKLGLAGKLHFAGFVSEVAVAFAAFDIAVMASLTEGFPFALAEAMAAGKPVVVTAVGGMKEMVQHEVNGLLVPPADSAALAQGWLRLLRDPALREKFGQAARERSQAFSVERNVAALEELYTQLLSNGRAH